MLIPGSLAWLLPFSLPHPPAGLQVRGYVGLLSEKRKELGDKATKLSGGLTKLDETSVQVRCRGGGLQGQHFSYIAVFWQPCAGARAKPGA